MSVEQGLSSFLADRSQATCCADEDNHDDNDDDDHDDDEAEAEEGENRCRPFAGMRTKGWGGIFGTKNLGGYIRSKASFCEKLCGPGPVGSQPCL